MSQEILGTVFVPRKETLEGFIKRQENQPDKKGVILVLGIDTGFLRSIVCAIKNNTSRAVVSGNFNNSFNKNKWQELLRKGTVNVDGKENKKVCAVVIVVSSANHDIGASLMGSASHRVFVNYAPEMAAGLSAMFGDGVIVIRE